MMTILGMAMIMAISTITVKSDEINPDATHFDYQQGVGRIIENYHYVHFFINTSSLKRTYGRILTDYTILSSRKELKNSSLLMEARLLCQEIYQDLQEIAPFGGRRKRGLINGVGKMIKYIFGNPDSDDLEKINNYLENFEKQQNEDISVLNKSISCMNQISRTINSNTEIINKNLRNLMKTLNDQNTRFELIETVVTLIVQEQHFLNLLGKIKRSFVFIDEKFNLEILTHEQILSIKTHLLELYSQKELISHYHNLLDFRFAQGSVVTIHDSIIYTIKIPILNSIEFSLFQRLAIINRNNQTEIVTIPWKLDGSIIKLFSRRCQLIYQSDYVCYQILAEDAKTITISINAPLALAYPLLNNLILISSNYKTEIENNKNKETFFGTKSLEETIC
ncbi:uncharacterized protein LOC116418037 [Nasonia vitripennis]|uniref:Uncharacterized protein n=1 Tax=Nasonia vitripennis TaxID=7425 RepID=A0A7M7QKK1_NASVI|nr:uncharacterized protein LOC116418037 [Nasonia vitripennis]